MFTEWSCKFDMLRSEFSPTLADAETKVLSYLQWASYIRRAGGWEAWVEASSQPIRPRTRPSTGVAHHLVISAFDVASFRTGETQQCLHQNLSRQ